MGTRRDILHLLSQAALALRVRREHARQIATSKEFLEDAAMPRTKQTSTRKRATKAAAMKALGAAGLGLSLVGGTSASTLPSADIPQSDTTSPNQRFVLGDEEMADVTLATFHLFDRENTDGGVQLARGGCGGCHGCGGCRGCGGCGFGGVVICVGCIGCAGCAGCCLSWGACRLC